MDSVEVALRLVVAAAAGTAIGVEREWRGQLAGIRTNALVAIGAAAFTIVGALGFPELSRSANVDPMRVAAQIVSGIGFIGAGVIIREGGAVKGVTTAAALWTSASLGMAAGAGLPEIALIGTAVVLAALVGLRLMRERAPLGALLRRIEVEITYNRGHGTLAPIVDAIESAGGDLERLRIHDTDEERVVTLRVRSANDRRLAQELQSVAGRPEVLDVAYDQTSPSAAT